MTTTGGKGVPAHFFLACAEITFVNGAKETGITRLNTVIRSPKKAVGVLLMGRAQQAVQLQLINNLDDPTTEALNIVFISISYLGNMTDEEFHRTEEVVGHG